MRSTLGIAETASYVSFADVLGQLAAAQSSAPAYTYLADVESSNVHITFGELDHAARAIAAALQETTSTGDRAVLLYPPGLDYIASFFGCLYAGVVAVPAYPPDPTRLARTLPRLRAIACDARPSIVLTTSEILTLAQPIFDLAPELGAHRWRATDAVPGDAAVAWRRPAVTTESLAFLQYTSGSTGTPKGVMVTHGNLLHNSAAISRAFVLDSASRGMSWLPPYHDMGLIGGILQPLFLGAHTHLMSPLAFLQRPMRWLEAVSRYRATTSGAPNFAYDLCVRKSTPEARAALDLSSWTLAFCGAEPVRAETLARFEAAFAPAGFRSESFYPCYGLAEATLIVTGSTKGERPVVASFASSDLARGEAVPAHADQSETTAARSLVGCGKSIESQRVIIVRPGDGARCAAGRIGEIWVSGPSVAGGYWQRPDDSERTFRARTADGDSPFLRTGDLGFLRPDGELFVTGRIKDLILIRGRNHYPQDIELTVEQSSRSLRPGCGAAFSVDMNGEEQLVIVAELEERATQEARSPDASHVVEEIRRAIVSQHDVHAHAIVLLRARTIPKTSSGKVERYACRDAFVSDRLDVVYQWSDDGGGASTQPSDAPPAAWTEASVTEWLRLRIATLLGVPVERIDPSQPLSRHGLDSLDRVDLLADIEARVGVELPPGNLLKSASLEDLARLLVRARDLHP